MVWVKHRPIIIPRQPSVHMQGSVKGGRYLERYLCLFPWQLGPECAGAAELGKVWGHGGKTRKPEKPLDMDP